MVYFVIIFISLAVGGGIVFFLTEHVRRVLEQQRRRQATEEIKLRALQDALANKEKTLESKATKLSVAQTHFDNNVISYEELKRENAILKVDLRNVDVNLRKQQLDRNVLRENQNVLDEKVEGLGRRFLKDSVKWISSSLNPNNFATSKQRLLDVIERCRSIGLKIARGDENELISDLKADYEKVVRAAVVREEQARIRAQIREEQQRELEIDRVQKQLAREKRAVEEALADALALAKDQYSEEVERLKIRLAEAESRQRSISQAELTKSGHVYVISNLGSFGENVFKVGMTRRLDPMDRVKELGDASVPFPFDVHMMISSDDAPALENALHRKLHKLRINKTNPRKEFFRTDVMAIHKIVTEHHGVVEYTVDAEALQFRESLTMSDEEEEYIENIFATLEDENDPDADEE